MKRPLLSCLALFTTAILSMAADDRKKPLIFVPVLPYEFVFEKIGGDLIEVHSIVGEGDDAHSYTPTPKQIMKLASADLICSGALGFESNYFVKIKEGKTVLEKLICSKALPCWRAIVTIPVIFKTLKKRAKLESMNTNTTTTI